ncbi:hypothetical protein N5P37_011154, partial [Trichoderma harzianum]
ALDNMRLFSITTLLVGIAAAIPSPRDVRGDTPVRIRIGVDKAASQTALTVLARDRDVIIGKSRSTSLNTGNFAQVPIISQLDDNGSGTGSIMIGNNVYTIHSDTNASGGISCSADFSSTDFNSTDFNSTDFNSTDFNSTELDTELSKRQTPSPCTQWSPFTEKDGDGSPTQRCNLSNSENIFCGAANECSAGREDSTSYTIGFSVAGALTRWASVGFAVEQSRSTGNTYTCTGQRNERVCVRYMMAHTNYNVFNSLRNGCGSISRGNRARITSPNANNKGGGYLCGIGAAQCNYKNYRWWDLVDHKGGSCIDY